MNSSPQKNATVTDLVQQRNDEKYLFTAGPASLLPENLSGLRPCFGRGDEDYTTVETRVLDQLKAMSGHSSIARLQGSASLALEIMALNFLEGDVLVVSTGYYSDRLQWLAESAQRRQGAIRSVTSVPWGELYAVQGSYDWVWACPTETSAGILVPISTLRKAADSLGAKLMLDATASIGLESDHDLAQVIAYSSCKGLFGLTGACFIAFNGAPTQEVDSFYLSLQSHRDKRMTGPYHAIASLADVLPQHDHFREGVVINKRRFVQEMEQWLTQPAAHQPQLCTHVTANVTSSDARAVLYAPRSNLGGSVVCHLGEAHLGASARGDIQDVLTVTAP